MVQNRRRLGLPVPDLDLLRHVLEVGLALLVPVALREVDVHRALRRTPLGPVVVPLDLQTELIVCPGGAKEAEPFGALGELHTDLQHQFDRSGLREGRRLLRLAEHGLLTGFPLSPGGRHKRHRRSQLHQEQRLHDALQRRLKAVCVAVEP